MNIASLQDRLKDIEGRIANTANIIQQCNNVLQQHTSNWNALHGSKQEVEFWLGELTKVAVDPSPANIAEAAIDAVENVAEVVEAPATPAA